MGKTRLHLLLLYIKIRLRNSKQVSGLTITFNIKFEVEILNKKNTNELLILDLVFQIS